MKGKESLKKALDLVLRHKNEIDKELFEGIHFKVLNIRKGDSSRENLRRWFILVTGPGWRAGKPPHLEERREMMKRFDEWYEKAIKILQSKTDQDAMDEIVKGLVNIKYIGYKIAGVYLRDIVYHFKVWPQLCDYLYLPIDRHVRDILVNKLRSFEDEEVPKVGESYFSKRSRYFQEVLNEIHKPRVEFDYFWVVGAKFCSFHLCNFCWIQKFCHDKSPI